MRALYVIIAVVMLFMFVLVADTVDLGTAGTLLSTGFAGVFFYCIFLFAMDVREGRKRPDEQTSYKTQLYKLSTNIEAAKAKRRRSKRGY